LGRADSYDAHINWRERISVDPGIRFGKACVSGTRIAVEDILGWLAAGMTVDEIVAEYPPLTADDVRACLERAADAESNAGARKGDVA
jgi:uncharacterized protein (DUF433 family)